MICIRIRANKSPSFCLVYSCLQLLFSFLRSGLFLHPLVVWQKRTHQLMKVFARFCGHARTNMRKFWSSFFKSLRHQRRVALVALRVRAKCSRTVCTERCKYPVSALAERGCKSARDIGGRHRIYYNFDITKCAVRFFFAKLFLWPFASKKKR